MCFWVRDEEGIGEHHRDRKCHQVKSKSKYALQKELGMTTPKIPRMSTRYEPRETHLVLPQPKKKKSQVPMRWDSNSVEDRRMQGEEKKKKTVGRERKKADRETWAIEGITDVLNIQGRSSWWRRRLTTQEYRIEQVINNVISLGWGFVKDFEDCKEKKENLNWKRELFKYVEGRERLRFLL